MSDLLAEFRPIKFWQRMTPAAIALAGVPMIAALVLFCLNLFARLVLQTPARAFGRRFSNDYPLLRTLVEILQVSIFTPAAAWIGLFLLIAVTSWARPDIFMRSWFATTATGAGLGGALCLLMFGILALMEGISSFSEIWTFLGIFASYGAVYALAYWLALRILFIRPPPDPKDVFS